MGKPRRPRNGPSTSERTTGARPASRRPGGPRSTWEPVPPLDPADPAPPAETVASPASAPEPVDGPAPVELVAEAEPPVPTPAAPVAETVAAPEPIPEPASALEPVDGPAPAAPVAEFVAPPPAVPAPVAEPSIPEPTGPDAPSVPVARAARPRVAFAPERLDVADIGATVAGYMRGEGEAVAAHLRALGAARSPADVIRLQVGEIQRAADASLTCWSTVARKVGRIFAFR